MRLVDPAEPSRGLAFDGRVAEDFKLATGTWVHVSRLRIEALPVLAPLVQDLVITGHDRAEIGALLVLNPAALTARGIAVEARDGALVGPSLAAALAEALRRLAASATGSSTRIARALALAEPPLLGEGETTDKGNLNQRRILTRRADLVARLYDDGDPAVIRV